MWAESHSWSLTPFKEKSHVRLFPAADFNPQVILCSSRQGAGGGEETTAARAAVPPAWEGRWAAVPSALGAASDPLAPRNGAKVRLQQASAKGRNSTHRLHVCAAHPTCSPAMGQDVWQVTTLVGEPGTPHCSQHLPQNMLAMWKPMHTSWKAKGCSWNIQRFRHATIYPDLPS